MAALFSLALHGLPPSVTNSKAFENRRLMTKNYKRLTGADAVSNCVSPCMFQRGSFFCLRRWVQGKAPAALGVTQHELVFDRVDYTIHTR